MIHFYLTNLILLTTLSNMTQTNLYLNNFTTQRQNVLCNLQYVGVNVQHYKSLPQINRTHNDGTSH